MTDMVLRTARPASISALLNPVGMLAELWSRRDLIGQFSQRYFLARHRGTHLGMVWALLFPLVLLAVYSFIFNFVFTARSARMVPDGAGGALPETQTQYAVALFLSLTIFNIFSESVVRSAGLVLDNTNYVKRVVFPLEVLPVSSLMSAVKFSLFGLGLSLAGVVAFYPKVYATVLLLPVVVLPMLALALGLAWFIASLAVFVRDIGNLVVIVVGQILFFLTPIFYRADDLKEWAWIVRVNPLGVVIESARQVTLYGQMPDWRALAGVLVVGLVVMQLGYAWFMKSKRGFADVL
jgi:lipopolysaccharide transport system permease protein